MSDKKCIDRARSLRKQSTKVEHILWMKLRASQMGVKFRRQQPIDHYVVDFYCPELGLVIEVDGGQHTPEKDAIRTRYLENQGKTILRFWNNEVTENLDGVWGIIKRKIDEMRAKFPHPPSYAGPLPLPQGERENPHEIGEGRE